MERDREDWLARTFVELVGAMQGDDDAVGLLGRLATRAVELLGGADVGVVLRGPHGGWDVVASSTERLHLVVATARHAGEGPVEEVAARGEPLLNLLVADAVERWPVVAVLALEAGYRRAHVVPLREGAEIVGALVVLQESTYVLRRLDARLLEGLADVVMLAIAHRRSLDRVTELAEQLEEALRTRVVLEQAKGMVAAIDGVDTEEAFQRLRAHARRTGTKLHDVAQDVVELRSTAGLAVDPPSRSGRGGR